MKMQILMRKFLVSRESTNLVIGRHSLRRWGFEYRIRCGHNSDFPCRIIF